MFYLLFSLLIIASGCSVSAGPSSKATATPLHQAELAHVPLSIGPHQLDVRLATTAAEREEGLMKQTSLGANEGMLFVFPRAQRVAFWMKETPLPLSIAYLAGNGRILEIHDLKPLDEHSLVSSSSTVVYALETPRGWFTTHQVLSGDSVTGLPPASSAN